MVVSSGCAPDAPRVIARVARYDIDDVMRAAVAAYPDPALRTIDATHLATTCTVFGTNSPPSSPTTSGYARPPPTSASPP
ncbi:MAG TPA: hypothetical protein VN959_04350, partial [Mycobacterium sp.]|nr:hypothetical protein [Mycobacterium sp.]